MKAWLTMAFVLATGWASLKADEGHEEYAQLMKKVETSFRGKLDSTYYFLRQLDTLTSKDTVGKRRGKVMYNYAIYFYHKRNPDSAIYYFKQAENYASADGDSATVARMIAASAYTQWAMGNRDSALVDMYKSHDMLARLGDSLSLGICKMNIAISLDTEGEPAKALEYLLDATKLLESVKNEMNLAKAYMNTALIYAKLEKMEKAIDYNLRSIEVFENLGDSISIGLVASNLSSVYTNNGQEQKAYALLKRAEAIYESVDNPYGRVSTYSALLQYHAKKEVPDPEKAIYYGDLSIELGKKIKSLDMVVQNLQVVANVYFGQLHDIENSIKYNQEALKIGRSIDAFDYQRLAHKTLAFQFKQASEKDSSIYHFEKFLVLNDSLVNREKIEEFKANELQYEFDKERLADSLKTINERQALELSHATELASERQGKLLLTAAVVFAVVLVVFLTILFGRKRAQEKVLNEKNELIETALKEKEVLLKEIHHRVKNNFQVVSSLLELQSRGITDTKAKELAEEGQNRVKSMALIHQRLYQNDDLLISFDEYTQALVDEISALFDMEVETQIDAQNVAFDIDTAIPLGLILNELITNAFKYGLNENDKKLSIHFEKLDDQYKMVVKDNGKGMDPDFNLAKAKSLGLRLVNRLSQQLKGKAEILREEGAAFAVYFKDTEMRKVMN